MAADPQAADPIAGFVAATLHANRLIGEIVMLAVRPAEQDQSPARRCYERADYQLLPIARYFRPL
jgi:hypothetical protein